MDKPKIIVSSCILGSNVRYDGNNKFNAWIVNTLSKHCELISVCPEVTAGMSVPREPVNLIQNKTLEVKMQGINSKIDHTENMLKTSIEIISNINNVSGIILQKNSPSCGLEKVKLYTLSGELIPYAKENNNHRGLFAKIFIQYNPQVPTIESDQILDFEERENFLRSVYCHFRFSKLDGSIEQLQDFHNRYKFLLMEYSQKQMGILENICANSLNVASATVYMKYAKALHKTFSQRSQKKNKINTFQYIIDFLKDVLSSEEKKIIHQLIIDYGKNLLPYTAPFNMIEMLIKKHQQYYLLNDYYLMPFPKELVESNINS